MVRELDDLVYMGGLDVPTSVGRWDHYSVGGEKLINKEAIRCYNDPNCAFVWEHLDDIHQRKEDAPNQQYDKYRPIDYETIDLMREQLRSWLAGYREPFNRDGDAQLKIETDSFYRATGRGPSRKTLEQANELAELYLESLNKATDDCPALWQTRWPNLPPRVFEALASQEWGSFLTD
eukprot:10659391-Karenia_brevis.AAC.1